jgi:hypothetical protein
MNFLVQLFGILRSTTGQELLKISTAIEIFSDFMLKLTVRNGEVTHKSQLNILGNILSKVIRF